MSYRNKLISLIIILAMSFTFLFSCSINLQNGNDGNNSGITDNNGGADGSGDSDGNSQDSSTANATKLPAPTTTISDTKISWLAVEGAEGYEISIDGVAVALSKDTLYYTPDKTCTVRVRAIGNGTETLTGNWSPLVTIEIEAELTPLSTPTVALDGEYAVWTAVAGAAGYEIDFGGRVVALDADVLTYKLNPGESVRVRAIGDNESYISGEWSERVFLEGDTHFHTDDDDNDKCDVCGITVIVTVDFYAINDLHGKFCDTDKQPGVDELGTYLNNAKKTDDYTVFLSSGDMWQGSAESNLTGGFILTEWMNEMGFVSMTLGNHEFDWGEEKIKSNLAVADFPFLAINIYDNSTGQRVEYCKPSVMVDLGDVQIGIIGAIGNCYSSISSDRVEGIHFKTGKALTELVKAESNSLKAAGADLIVYSLHDGSDGVDTYSLKGYIDIVFEGHTHSAYEKLDINGIYHLQGGGENNGITHAEISINFANGTSNVNIAEVVYNSNYSSLEDDSKTEDLEEKYRDVINEAYSSLGTVTYGMSSNEVENYVAALYVEAALKKWGDKYDIVLGGGYLNTRSPYDLPSGSVCYADILSIFPFDNRLVLCSIPGYTLKNRFINPTGEYNTAFSDYGNSIKNSIDPNGTYYVIVDTYTQLYRANNLTAIEYFDDNTFARDLLADAIREGRLDKSVDHSGYTLTEISDLLAIGENLGRGDTTEEYYYVKGKIIDDPHATYGNLTLADENGNTIYLYRLYDNAGNKYSSFNDKPVKGDTIVVYSKLYNYYSSSQETLELKDAILVEIVD